MTVQEFVDSQNEKLSRLETDAEPLTVAALSCVAEMSIRIFSKGLNADEQELLSVKPYSKKPLYLSPDIAGSTGTHIGKRGKAVKNKTSSTFRGGAKGTQIASAYFPGGYAEFKSQLGRPVLEVTNSLHSDWSNPFVTATATSVGISFKSEKNKKVAAGNEKLRGPIFAMTEGEVNFFIDEHLKELEKRNLL